VGSSQRIRCNTVIRSIRPHIHNIYTLKTKDGQFSLAQYGKVSKMDLPARRISTSSPAPPDFGRTSFANEALGSPVPSMPGTPQSLALPMNPPPPTAHSRRSSFSSSVSRQRSVSPAPSSLPLPAVMASNSPNMHPGLGVRNTNIYHNETLTSFFRRLTFAPDGSLLFTPAGQYKTTTASALDINKTTDSTIHTVFIYTRAGLNKAPIAYLPGHKKASVAVRCSPVYYTLRQVTAPTRQITIDTSAEDEISALPEAAISTKTTPQTTMDPPPPTSAPSPAASMTAPSPKANELDHTAKAGGPTPPPGPPPAFDLPYRIVYAVATQDAVHIYDTQQQKPLAIVSNLHFATFTDLAW
jgi:chromatin assembly factor 1 subunit B